jgi:hypothetical protein
MAPARLLFGTARSNFDAVPIKVTFRSPVTCSHKSTASDHVRTSGSAGRKPEVDDLLPLFLTTATLVAEGFPENLNVRRTRPKEGS